METKKFYGVVCYMDGKGDNKIPAFMHKELDAIDEDDAYTQIETICEGTRKAIVNFYVFEHGSEYWNSECLLISDRESRLVRAHSKCCNKPLIVLTDPKDGTKEIRCSGCDSPALST